MAETTVRSSISSSNLTSDAFSITASFDLTTDGTAGLELTTGLTRTKIGTSPVTIADGSTFTNNGENQLAYLFIKNFSSNVSSTVFDDSVKIEVSDGSSSHLVLGHLAGGQAVILPYSANNDIRLTADVTDTVVEFMLIHEG